ncbi:hypothetical protein GCM10022267_88480 [Lentzea roselyniae]|uniref:Aromatic amino acid lyase n=1 Tax=Lentzea roselyniae TaxID=531940 RepID=A0ABP7CD98_9PSEU
MNRLQLPGRLTTAWLEAAARPVEVVVATRARDRIAASHSAWPQDGRGPADGLIDQGLPVHLVRATMLAHLAWLSEGTSGASPDSVDALTAALRTTFAPAVASTVDPVAEILQALSGNGQAYFDGKVLAANEALRLAGLRPFEPTSADIRAFTGTATMMVAAAALHAARLREVLVCALEGSGRAVLVAELSRSSELADAIERIEQVLLELPTFGAVGA